MKYTPEELYTWSMENGYREQMVAAQYYNKRGFAARLVVGDLIKKDNQYYYHAELVNGIEIEEPVGNGTEKENAILDKVAAHPEILRVCIVTYDKKYRLRMTFAETEEERIAQMDQMIITDMFRLLDIDTHGKVRKLAEDVKEEMSSRQAWNIITEGAKKKLDKLKKENK